MHCQLVADLCVFGRNHFRLQYAQNLFLSSRDWFFLSSHVSVKFLRFTGFRSVVYRWFIAIIIILPDTDLLVPFLSAFLFRLVGRQQFAPGLRFSSVLPLVSLTIVVRS